MSEHHELLSFNELQIEPSGPVEHTDFTDINRAVATFAGGVLNALVITDTERKENQEFARFANKSIREKLFLGRFEDAQSFIQEVAAKRKSIPGKGEKEPDIRSLLPACHIYRETEFSFTEGDDYQDLTGFGELSGDSGNVFASINKSFVKLTYTLVVLSWNRETADRIALGFSMWLRHTKKGRKHVFSAQTKIASASIRSTIEVNTPRNISPLSEVVDINKQRVFGYRISFDVIAEVYEAEAVEASLMRYVVSEPESMS
ncbi:hypothetical protein L4174_023870 (plasmid) [Photobacterium sp. CCB-ST2H9]|uniref:hypothetical protein n=1 Tax=Photobacterium sp. CCB-ST2H9 TaxID=2912855 RepID=UPI002003735F|nr:hypothetical protein [Photobacterium sp. CCB-ST2H9]UTM60425.1 hypothetical protein L4174_023870 [Photobacterium sp. CCB-ST2H9]